MTNVLYVYAAPDEGAAIAAAHPQAAFAELGVGPVRSAVRLTEVLLAAAPKPDLVCLFGAGGVYPDAEGDYPLDVGDLVVVVEDTFADEGVETEKGFRSLQDLGLAEEATFEAVNGASLRLASHLGGLPRVRGATTGTGSGTDARAAAIAARSGAQVESMEGAAVGLVCARQAVPWVQLRCISNRTGDRELGGWDLSAATAALSAALAKLIGEPVWADE